MPRPAPVPMQLFARPHCGLAAISIPPRPHPQRAGNAVPHRAVRERNPESIRRRWQERKLSRFALLFCGSGSFLCYSDTLCQALQFGAVEDFGVHHSDQQGLYRALAEPVHDALDGAAGDLLARLGGTVDEGAVFSGMSEVAFLL